MAAGRSVDSPNWRWPTDSPDSLQDLCIFYCMNHLDVLMERYRGHHDNQMSVLPLPVRNKMLNYLTSCCLPNGQTIYDARYPWKAAFAFFALSQEVPFSNLILHRKNVLADNAIISDMFERNTFINLDVLCCNLAVSMNTFHNLVRNSLASVKYLRFQVLHVCDIGMIPRTAYKDQLLAHWQAHAHNLSSFLNTDSDVSSSSSDDVYKMDRSVQQRLQSTSGHENKCQSAHTTNSASSGMDWSSPNSQSTTECSWHDDCDGSQALMAPCLQTLALSRFNLVEECNTKSIDQFLSRVPQITSLVLVDCGFLTESSLKVVATLCNLQSLVLSDTIISKFAGDGPEYSYLKSLKQLRHLDLSTSQALPAKFNRSAKEEVLQLVLSLPRLVSLDLSGTTIPNYMLDREAPCSDNCRHKFGKKKFEFLGLWNCSGNPCEHQCLPAHTISGNHNEGQVLVALRSHLHNDIIAVRVISYVHDMLDNLSRITELKNPCAIIEGLIAYLETYPEGKKEGQCKTLLCLYKLLKHSSIRTRLTIVQRRRLLERLLVLVSHCMGNSVCGHAEESAHIINYVARVALILLLFLQLPGDAIYCHMFEHYVHSLVSCLGMEGDDSHKIQALRHLHAACRASQYHKELAGDKLALTKDLLDLLERKLEQLNEVDDIMEKIWSVIWTLTDEVPRNCEKFIEHSGLQVLLACADAFPDEQELFRKMSGALSNVSENPHLRPMLMNSELIKLFRSWMTPANEDIDISSHAVSFLIQLAADGPEAWTVEEIGRQEVLSEIEEVMDKWNPHVPRGVKFRSLGPMLILIKLVETPQAPYWGAWTILNLVKIKAERYCCMLREEGGEPVLEEALKNPFVLEKVKTIILDIQTDMKKYYDLGQASRMETEEDS